jgi:molybdenum cofactor cytidylyltransferase
MPAFNQDKKKDGERTSGVNLASKRVAGIILAAGASTRMGKTKQLLPVKDGRSLLERILHEALKSDLDKVILVLGHQARRIRTVLKEAFNHPKLKVVENRRYPEGISSSVKAGLIEVEKSHDHMMILLADMPQIDAGLINQLIHGYLSSRLPLGAVKVGNKRAHPVIFNRELYQELYLLRGDVGARSLFAKYPHKVFYIKPEKPFDDRDIDTWEDYLNFWKF